MTGVQTCALPISLVQFHLVDSIGKKITVVKGVAESLGLSNIRADQVRAEGISETYDFVVSRAVTRLQPFMSWMRYKITKRGNNDIPNGVLYLKGGDLAEELAEIPDKYKVYNLSDYFTGEFFETKKVVHIKK